MLRSQTLAAALLASAIFEGSAIAKGHPHSFRDANHDKLLSSEEFAAKSKARFEKLDANHDGSLDRSERTTVKKYGKGFKKDRNSGKKRRKNGKKHQADMQRDNA